MKFKEYPVVEMDVKGEALRFEQDNGSMHVGTSVWPCSLVLVKWLERALASPPSSSSLPPQFHTLNGLSGVELGSGCGVAGLGLALLGLSLVTLTDIAAVMPALKRNVKKNVASTSLLGSHKVKIAPLIWGNPKQLQSLKPPFDLVIAADVVYIENCVEPLLSTMHSLASPSSLVLLGYQLRSPEAHELFWSRCPHYFDVTMVPHDQLHPDYAFEEADVYILKKKEPLSN